MTNKQPPAADKPPEEPPRVRVELFSGDVREFASLEELIAEAERIVQSSGLFAPDEQSLIRACSPHRESASMSERLSAIAWTFSASPTRPRPIDAEVEEARRELGARQATTKAADERLWRAVREYCGLTGQPAITLRGRQGGVTIGMGHEVRPVPRPNPEHVRAAERDAQAAQESYEAAAEDEQRARRGVAELQMKHFRPTG